MGKINLKTPDLVKKNIEAINAAFPNVITEVCDEQGRMQKAVNFELLKQELSTVLVEGDKERYQLTWPGKRQAILQANAPISQTLRPVREDSVDWDTTQNLYIEGDNLEVLKLLQESYLNKVKCIYIDPPYNTGNDFIYKDDFRQETAEYLQDSGQLDDEGNRLFQNNESNGRFHSDWLTMMYPRLKLARNLLRDDGVVFISIDDNEVDNLRKICHEIFGESNFIEQLVWKRRATPPNDRVIGKNHEYILAYAKNIDCATLYLQPRSHELDSRYANPDNDPKGKWVASDLSANGKGGRLTESCIYPITNPMTRELFYPPANKCWLFNQEKMNAFIEDGRIGFRPNSGAPYLKRYLVEVRQGSTLPTILDNCGFSFDSAKEIKDLFEVDIFEFPKPIKLLTTLLRTGTGANDLLVDFFSGSATTAQAAMQLNAEDGGNRKYIMVQLPELSSEDTEAYKAGYKSICEIGKERIRRAAKKIKEETGAAIDYGFRAFQVDSTNMKDVYHSPQELNQAVILDLESNIKDDRTGEDLLIQVMLSFGLPLSLPMETKKIMGRSVYFVAENSLVACFAEEVQQDLVRAIAKEQPLRVVFRDSSFTSDAARINVEEVFKALSPSTEIKVL